MSGPPKTPTNLRILRGNPSHRPLPRGEPQPQIAESCPEPPPFVTGYAADQWWTVAPELHRLGLLTKVDVACLAAFCQSYARLRTAEEALARMADRDEHTGALLVTAVEGNVQRNPLIRIAQDAAKDMLAFGGQFGMTPASRVRLAAGGYGPSPPSKFDGLLK